MTSIEIKAKRLNMFLEIIKGKEKLNVLDIGCQNGYLCDQILKCGNYPYGIEIDENVIVEAQKTYPNIVFKKADCEQSIPYDDKYFDVVWCGDVIEHIRFTDIFVNEINRVLKMGGLFVLTTPMHNIIKNCFISLLCFEKHFNPEFPHYRFYTPKSIRKVLEKRGFEVKEINYIGRIPIVANSMLVISKKTEDKKYFSEHRF